MKNVESAIQSALLNWIKQTYPATMVTATANERSYRETAQIGCLGIPDLLLFYRSGPILFILFLELKKKKGKLLPSQKEWATDYHKRFSSMNTVYEVAYGFSDAKALISAWMHFRG